MSDEGSAALAHAHAEVASLATTLDDVQRRVTATAELLLPRDEHAAAELFEVERSLRVATRRLDAAVRRLR